jgi:hypothetical protein
MLSFFHSLRVVIVYLLFVQVKGRAKLLERFGERKLSSECFERARFRRSPSPCLTPRFRKYVPEIFYAFDKGVHDKWG